MYKHYDSNKYVLYLNNIIYDKYPLYIYTLYTNIRLLIHIGKRTMGYIPLCDIP